MRRVAAGDVLSDEDYDPLVEDIVEAKELPPPFGLEHLPKAAAEDLPVRLVSIAKPEHVNALESDQPLTFEPQGLTIVYGDNGSGKSGYARLLKRITRARHQEDVLSDVFRDTTLAKPTAAFLSGSVTRTSPLPGPTRPGRSASAASFYAACGNAYIATESDFPTGRRRSSSWTASSRPASRSARVSTPSWTRTAPRPTSCRLSPSRRRRPMPAGFSVPLGELVGRGARRADREVRRSQGDHRGSQGPGSAPAQR